MNELDERSLKAIEKVEKLVALRDHPNTGEGEATAAAEAIQKLLEAYNLDIATIEQHSGKTGKREDTLLTGGLYKWQRILWKEVAQLNFCIYRYREGTTKGTKYQHRLIGRVVNVRSTKVMAEYLQHTIERMARERVNGDGTQFFTKSSISFREGMADRIVMRLQLKRQEQLDEDRRKKAEEAAKRSHPAYTPSTALVLVDVLQAELDANEDVLWGREPGTTSRYRAQRELQRAEAETAYQAALAAEEKWRQENPEEARLKDEAAARREAEWRKKEERNARRRKGRAYYGPSYKGDPDAYREGKRAGEGVGLDQQLDRRSDRRLS